MKTAIRAICFTILLSAFSFRAAAEDFTNAVPVQLNHSQPDVSLVAVPEPSAKAISNDHSRMTFPGVTTIWNLVIPALFSFTGISA
jgi:hypothetical protein